MPIIPDYLEDIHSPELRKSVPPNTPIIVYHGTSSRKLANILSHGSLDPNISSQPEYRSYENSSPGIYVTISSSGFFGAELFAWHAAKSESEGDGSDPVVLELNVPLGWIDPDPDDSRIVDDQRNQASKTQGRILRPINIKRIRGIQVKNSDLAQRVPYGSDDIFDRDKTKWMPIGRFLDLLSKIPILPPEYEKMVSNRPPGMSRSETYEEQEQRIADKLVQLYQTFNSIDPAANGLAPFDAALVWVYNNKNNLWGNALSSVSSFFEYMNPGSFEYYENTAGGSEYFPRPNESLFSFLDRLR